MADDKSIDELERDVEQARSRLAADIALLRAPETFEAAKSGVFDAAYGYRDQMREKATGYGNGMLDTWKAKAAANPLAVAAIGAGIAWRLYKHPPITTVLVGLGLASLMRTDPNDDSMHPRRLMETASEKAMELKDRAAAQVAELRETAVGAMEEKVHEWTAAAESVVESAAERVSSIGSPSSSQPRGDGAAPTFAQTRDPEALGVQRGRMRAPTADIPYPSDEARSLRGWQSSSGGDRRDAYLLGVAALAVGAAVGLSRMGSGEDIADDFERDNFDDEREVVWRRY
ncbi:MAG: hypothetical protein K2Y29_06340 [Beijerinckiaceae bacterium]|nr:hypothetical protein [Beijerinckiaceae bacterium]